MRRPPITKGRVPVADRNDIDLLVREAHRQSKAKGARGFIGLRNETIIKLVFDTGLRLSEVVGLRLQDVDTRGSQVRVLGKGNKERRPYFGEEVREQLQRYVKARNYVAGKYHTGTDADAPFFITPTGRPLTRSGLTTTYRRLRQRVGVRDRFHGLRHAFAAAWVSTGGSPFGLLEQLGHTDLEMVRVYVRNFGNSRKEEAKRHSPVDNYLR